MVRLAVYEQNYELNLSLQVGVHRKEHYRSMLILNRSVMQSRRWVWLQSGVTEMQKMREK